jgi:hypothetical protein
MADQSLVITLLFNKSISMVRNNQKIFLVLKANQKIISMNNNHTHKNHNYQNLDKKYSNLITNPINKMSKLSQVRKNHKKNHQH